MIVLDTSVVSYIFNDDSRGLYYKERILGDPCVISFQTLEEMWFGAFKGGWGDRRKNDLGLHLRQYELMWPTPGIVEVCAHLRAECMSAGREIQVADAWIAATAIFLDCPLASSDHIFQGIPGLELVQAS